ncbi:MAG: hypothetical protein JWP97_2796 [Labilithrix sp.]|nr:hypothetical protein [Labilithrix sp.]
MHKPPSPSSVLARSRALVRAKDSRGAAAAVLAAFTATALGIVACSTGSTSGYLETDAAADAVADGRAGEAGDGGGDAAPASSCGEIPAGARYLLHFTNTSTSSSCGDGSDAIVGDVLHGFGDSCKTTRDDDACEVTIACHDVNGRYLLDSTTVWKLGGPGIAKVITAKTTSSTEDTLGSSGPDVCTWDLTYTLQK